MASGRKPGPQGSYSARWPTPGPLGPAWALLTSYERGEIVSRAFARAIELAPAALYRETGGAFGGASRELVSGLVGVLQANKLPALGLEFLPQSAGSDLAETVRVLQSGLSKADGATGHRGAERDSEIEQAAEELARAAGILCTRDPERHRGVPVDQGIQGGAASRGAASLQQAGQFFRSVGRQNWNDLLTNPQLRPRPKLGGGGAAAERVSSGRVPRAPAIPVVQPAAEPPTFSSDAMLEAQAATLVAAAAVGAPFCPV